jgi:hypothetical protein
MSEVIANVYINVKSTFLGLRDKVMRIVHLITLNYNQRYNLINILYNVYKFC